MTNLNMLEINDMFSAVGIRPKKTLINVMRAMVEEPDALITHAQLLSTLEKHGEQMDRVTLYRTLERLTCAGLLLSIVDHHRITRFAVSKTPGNPTNQQSAARFECQVCSRQFLLTRKKNDLSAVVSEANDLTNAAGHLSLEVDVAVRGICSKCIPS